MHLIGLSSVADADAEMKRVLLIPPSPPRACASARVCVTPAQPSRLASGCATRDGLIDRVARALAEVCYSAAAPSGGGGAGQGCWAEVGPVAPVEEWCTVLGGATAAAGERAASLLVVAPPLCRSDVVEEGGAGLARALGGLSLAAEAAPAR